MLASLRGQLIIAKHHTTLLFRLSDRNFGNPHHTTGFRTTIRRQSLCTLRATNTSIYVAFRPQLSRSRFQSVNRVLLCCEILRRNSKYFATASCCSAALRSLSLRSRNVTQGPIRFPRFDFTAAHF